MGERTWSGTHTFRASEIVYPRSVEEAADALRCARDRGRRVRGLGTRHSFNDVADTDGTLISMIRAVAPPVLTDAGSGVRVAAGSSYGALATWLESQGHALRNMGSLPHISVAGAISTGTHGSGDRNGVLATSVRRLTWLDALGGEHTATRGDAGFDGLVVALGAYGLLVEVELDIEPTYRVRQDVYRGVAWDALASDLDQVTAAGHSVSIFTVWDEPSVEQVWVKQRVDEDNPLGEEWLGGRLEDARAMLVGSSENLTEHGKEGAWLDRLPHFRVDSVPSHGDEIQTEYFVPRSHASAAVSSIREIGAKLAPMLRVSELRTVASDDLWLSPAYGRETFGIHFTWRNDLEGVRKLLPDVESALAPFAPRPHWGKVHDVSASQLLSAWDRLPEARKLYDTLDPSGAFSNDYLERTGIRSVVKV